MGHTKQFGCISSSTHKIKNENDSTWIHFNSFIFIKCTCSSWVIFDHLFQTFNHFSQPCIKQLMLSFHLSKNVTKAFVVDLNLLFLCRILFWFLYFRNFKRGAKISKITQRSSIINLYYDLHHFDEIFICMMKFKLVTRLKNKIENNSTWEGAFYQSEWVKINSKWVFSFFHFKNSLLY